jgi:hypothetical protein
MPAQESESSPFSQSEKATVCEFHRTVAMWWPFAAAGHNRKLEKSMPFKANLEGATDEEEQHVIESVRLVKNFPKPGLDFKDLSILLGRPDAFQTVINSLVNRYRSRGITGDIRLLHFLPLTWFSTKYEIDI